MTRFATVTLAVLGLLATTLPASASSRAVNTIAAGGYDLVSYHQGAKPLRGNGNHVVEHDGATYLFIDADNADTFRADPDKYLPAYGGYCAFGVSVGKKFHGDPDVWEIVDGRLYLNLDNRIKGTWTKDIPGNIAKANRNWTKIQDAKPSDL
jgi:YHS domain-containing protein